MVTRKGIAMAKKTGKTGKAVKTAGRTAKPAIKTASVRKAGAGQKKAPVPRSPKQTGKKPPLSRAEENRLLGPKTFSDAELRHFKELIQEKRKETLEELDTLKESMMDVTTGEYISESSNYSLHMEQGTDAMEREKTFLFASRESKFLNQLDDALARIEGKAYGQCKVCGLLIPRERLEAVPTATTCAEYKNTNIPCERGRLALARKKQGK
jgi:RNA polymerase-binding protein DksA